MQYKNYYAYPGVFHIWLDEHNHKQIDVIFPDLPSCFAGPGPDATFEEALDAAREGLALHLEGMIEDNEPIPESTSIETLKFDKDFPEGGQVIVAFVDVILSLFRNKKTEYTRVNVTIPSWLKELAESKNVNYSKVLREGLYEVLDLNRVGVKVE
ncbi:MAG: type II toxin-antitoxin system HicB family antitoxin [Desulfotomaculaceae bacterium]|nr:type II toxin-antitoxin system HicB family antitoxin [Desulfotomaculaceae bacterium]